jgi:hypothetical protein
MLVIASTCRLNLSCIDKVYEIEYDKCSIVKRRLEGYQTAFLVQFQLLVADVSLT